jgi:hypothetical protein
MPSLLTGFIAALFAIALNLVDYTPAFAQTRGITPEAAKINQVKLTEDMVNRFLDSMNGVKALSKKYKGQTPRAHASRNPMAGLTGFLQAKEARSEMQSILTKHGFSDFPNWLGIARTVMITYGFVKSGRTPQQFDQEMQKSIAQIQNNPHLTPQQRAIILKGFAPTMTQLRPSPDNYELIKRMQPQVAAKIGRNRRKK